MYWDTEKNNYFSGLYVLGQFKKELFLGVPIHRIITVNIFSELRKQLQIIQKA